MPFYQGCHHEETSDFGSESDQTLTQHCATFSPVTPIFYCISAVYMSQRTFVQNLRKIYLIFLPRPRYLKSSQTHDFHSTQTSFWISPETVTYAHATGPGRRTVRHGSGFGHLHRNLSHISSQWRFRSDCLLPSEIGTSLCGRILHSMAFVLFCLYRWKKKKKKKKS